MPQTRVAWHSVTHPKLVASTSSHAPDPCCLTQRPLHCAAPLLQVPFVEPEQVPLPEVPEQPHEEPTPHFHPPELIPMEEFKEEEFVHLEPPTIPAAPIAPKFGKPQVCPAKCTVLVQGGVGAGEGGGCCFEQEAGMVCWRHAWIAAPLSPFL